MPTLDEAVDGVLGGAPARKDPMASAVDAVLSDDRVRTQQNLIGATRSNPDEAAKAVRLGAERGLPSDVVLRNLHEIEAQSVVKAASATLEGSPTLKRLVAERPDLPKQAIDEIDKLAEIEAAVRQYGELKAAKGPAPSVGSVFQGLRSTIPQTLNAVREGARLQLGDLFDAMGLLPRTEVEKREALRRAEQAQARTTYDDPDFESETGRAVYGGLKSTVQQAVGIAASVATGNPAPALAVIGAQTQAQAYTKYRARGAEPGMAALGSVGEGAVEVGTELIPMGFLVDKLGKTGMRDFMAGLLAREIPSEQLATVLQDALDTAIANPDKTWAEYLNERPSAAYQTLVSTVVQSGVMGGANYVLERAARATNQVNDAGRDAEVLSALSALAAQVQLRERNPEEFRAMLQSMADDVDGAPSVVRFDARTLVGEDGQGGLLNQEQITQFPGLAEQIAEAVSTGGEITVPVADLLTVAAGTPLEQKLLENARIGENELSQLEAQAAADQAESFIKTEAERVMAAMQDADTTRASAEVVKQTLVEQLNTAKRFTPEVNDAYATLVRDFYTVLASRMGVTPEQAYQAYPLRVQGENPAAPGEVLNERSQRPGALTVEGYHFSKEARPVISTGAFGTGLEGSGREQYQNAKDVRLRKRSSFYVDKGTGINPEAGVGGIGHRVQLSNVYDANSDPLRLRKGDQLAFESAVLDAGYSGYLDRLEGTQSGQVIMLGDQQFQPEVLGPMTKTSGAVVPAPAQRESRGRDRVIDALNANKNLPAGAPTLARWSELLSKLMPAEHQALADAGVFDGEQGENVYKSDLIRRFEENTPAEDYTQRSVKNMTPAISKLLRNLTPAERAKVGDATAAKVIAQLKNLPSAKEMAAVAYAGRAKRGWYRQSAEAISAIFGADGPRFAGLLAAMSPQCSVETNLLNTLNTWKNWVAAGRPQTRDAIVGIMGRSVQGNNLTDSVLPAWINNGVRALTSEDPSAVTMSGPKVNSFYRNLIGDVMEVTNDAWMANFALVDQTIFSGSLTKGGDPGKGSGYLAMNARVREAAATLTKLTGETWTPAEVQETVWSWAKTLYEMSASATEQRTARELIQEGALTDDLINSTPDFGSLFYDPKYATILEAAGYGDQLATLRAPVADAAGQPDEEPGTPGEAGPFAAEDQLQYELRAARRLELLAEERGNARAAAADRGVEDALAEANAEASEVLEQADTTATLADFSPANVGNLLSRTDWAILTAENPAGRQGSAEDNAAAMARLKADLAALGVQYVDAVGKYGQVENSVAVAGITEEEAALLGAKYGQESVLTPRGLVYMADGHVVPVTGQLDTFDSEPEDFYTTIPSTGARFAIGLDFEAGNEGAVLAQPAYHGTPYRGIEKFSTEHIGKGEGAQAYGWGLYFASNAEIAEFYRNTLSKPEVFLGDTALSKLAEGAGPEVEAARRLLNDFSNPAVLGSARRATSKTFWKETEDFYRSAGTPEAEGVVALLDKYGSVSKVKASGQLYEVDVPHDDELLAYDAPLKDQPAKVKAALEGLGVAAKTYDVVNRNMTVVERDFKSLADAQAFIKKNNVDGMPLERNRATGRSAYADLASQLGSDEAASKALLAAGVKGLKYLDANSRGPTASKNYNFVVFSGDDVAIRNQYYQGDLFAGDLADKSDTVPTNRVVSSKGKTQLGGNIDSAGQQIAATKQGLQNFWKWFGDSEVTAGAAPLRLYHSTNNDVGAFEIGRPTTNNYGILGDVETTRAGIFLSPNADFSQEYLRAGAGQNVMPVYAKIENPLDLRKGLSEADEAALEAGGVNVRFINSVQNTWELFDDTAGAEFVAALQKAGYDGAILREASPSGETQGGDTYVAFKPEQIKSAIGNRGTFDPNDPSIVRQGPRGTFNPNTLTVSLLQSANLSTFLHETGHFFLEVMADVGSQPNAPTGVVEDMGKLLNWFGVKDMATWNAMTLDQKRKHHERFAESFEQYLLEGKAPSVELQPLFQRFRAWLTNVYRSLSEFMRGRNLQLDDEVRAVFDRMLATDQQIKQAEELSGYSLLFKSAEQAGMTPEAWAAYQLEGAAATHEAIDKLQARSVKDMRWVSGARSRALKALQKDSEAKRRAIESEVAAEVAQMPVYQAMRWIRKGEMTTADGEEVKAEKGFRLSTAALAEMYPDTALDNPDLSRLKGMTAANGLHPDLVAAMFGFESGDALVRTLADAEAQSSVVEGMTDQRMLERFGDASTPQGIARAADEAVHNEARGRFIATGLRALQEANGKTEKTAAGGSINVMVRAAKQFAEQLVARRKVRELKPGLHTQAEARAGRVAQKAVAANDTQTAIVAQRDQLLNHYAARATNAAIDDVERSLTYLKKFDKEAVRKKLPIEYVDQIDKLLERVDLRQQTNAALDKRAKLAAWIKSQQDAGIDVELPDYLLEDAQLTSYRDMSVEAFRGLVETVKQIEHLGRLKNKLLTAKDEREFAAIRDSMVNGIIANSQGRVADTRTPTTVLGKKLQAIKLFGAAHIKAATYARIFDGGKDGGPVWEYLLRPANAAADRETTMIAEATRELSAILDPWRKAGNPNLRTPAPSVGRSLTRQERLVIALNTGNEGNLQRLLGGEGWTVDQVKPILDSLSRDDWKTVQAVWDHFDKRRALVDEVERNVYGKPLKKVDPGSVFTEAYKVKGGYYPIVYDPAASQRAEEHADAESAKRQLAGAYSAAHVRRGFTKARAEEVVGRPLMYDLSGVYRGVRDQIHYIAWTEWVIDANHILRDKAFDSAVRTTYGPEAVRQLKTWRDAVAEGDGAAQEAMDTALGWVRRSVSVAGLGFNVMSAMMQPLGFTQSITRVGAGWVGKGVMQYLANPVRATREVNGKSEFMTNRSRTRFREINELRNRVEQETPLKRMLNENAFALMMRVQQLVDVPTWLGAYEKAIAAGNTEDRARALADQAVIDSQGGGQTKDLSAIERGGPAQKLFTVFYTFMNTAANLGVASKMTPTSKAKFAADMLMLYTVPSVLGVFLKNALTPGDSGDEDEELLKKLAAAQLTFMFGLVVLGREVGEAVATAFGLSDHPRDYAGPAGVRALADAYQLTKQVGQGEFDDAFRKALVNTAGSLFGLPSAQINRTITGAQALKEGKTKNPAALLFGYQEPR